MSTTTCRRPERGVSLIEVVLTMTLFLGVSGAILGVFDVVTGAHHRQESTLEARQSLRLALDQIAADVRLGRTVIIADPAEASTELGVRGPEVEGRVHAVGYRNLAEGGLVRVTKGGTRMLLPGVADPDPRDDAAALPPTKKGRSGEGPPAATFHYLDDRGRELDPRVEDPDEIEMCTSMVRIDLRVVPEGSTTAVEATRTVALRNRDRGRSC